MEEDIIYRARFEGWILPRDHKGTGIGTDPIGPFHVEVLNLGTHAKPLWGAVLLPTRQPFGGRTYRTHKEACDTVAGNFRRQSRNWVESRPFVPEQTSLP